MTEISNQKEKVNNIVFLVSFILFAFSTFLYSQIYFWPDSAIPHFIKIPGIGYFAAFVIFAPIVYGLFSQNLSKSKLFGVLMPLSFLWVFFTGFYIMDTYSQFYYSFYTTIGTHLFSFVCFLILGYLGGAAGAIYHTGQGAVPFFSWKISVTSNVLIIIILLSCVFFVIGTLPFWSEFFKF